MSDNYPSIEAMKCAVDMEVHAALGTMTVEKGRVIDEYLGRVRSVNADLLDALKTVLPFAEHEAALAIPRDYRERMAEIVAQARAAIARAEGTA